MREYQSWTFHDRSFLWALAVSILWHFFWFFSVAIVVSVPTKQQKARPKMVSLGAVLDDRIFKTLVENKPQLSQTFYRQLSDFSPALDLKVKTIERHLPGEVVSVPEGKKFFNSLKELIGGNKASPDYEFASKVPAQNAEPIFEVQGDLKNRRILTMPSEPSLPPGAASALRDSQTEIEFTVEASGSVDVAQVVASSGDLGTDLLWMKYLRGWQFTPLAEAGGSDQKGRVKFHFRQEGEKQG